MAENRDTILEPLPESKRDLRAELDQLDNMLSELKVQYEQYFLGVITLAPDKLHNNVKRTIAILLKAPFRNSALNYRLKMLRHRYSTLNTYWQRVLRERDAGTYHRDVFRASMREKFAQEDAKSQTARGQADKQLRGLFDAYRSAVEKQSGKQIKLDFEAFQKSLVKRAQDFKQKNPGKKMSFKVVVKEGKVSVQAQAKG